MIAKRIHRTAKASDFQRLAAYLLHTDPGLPPPSTWGRTADYILDAAHQGEKVAWSRVSHCASEVPALAIAEVLATQAQNTRAKGDKTYHLVISFPTGEAPTRAQLEAIEDAFADGLGFAGHQRISAVHQDTDNLHIHLAINKIHPTTFRCVEPYYDHYRLDRICREQEQVHGLTVDNRIAGRSLPEREGAMEAHTGLESFLGWLRREVAPVLSACLSQPGVTWPAVHGVLADWGVQLHPRGAGLVMKSVTGPWSVRASQVARVFSYQALTQTLGPFQPPQLGVTRPSGEASQGYGPRPHTRGRPAERPLWEAYQAARAVREAERARQRQDVDRSHHGYLDQLTTWYGERRAQLQQRRLGVTPVERTQALCALRRAQEVDWAAARANRRAQSQRVDTQLPRLTWLTFLQTLAAAGNLEALALLRQRAQAQQHLTQALQLAQQAPAAEAVVEVVWSHLTPRVGKRGEVIYRLPDGGVVVDLATQLQVPVATPGAIQLAVSLAQVRFPAQALSLQGDPQFCQAAADCLESVRGTASQWLADSPRAAPPTRRPRR